MPRMKSAIGLALATQASLAAAQLVVFENRDSAFEWEYASLLGDGSLDGGTFLDITLPAAQQSGAAADAAIGFFLTSPITSGSFTDHSVFGNIGSKIALGTNVGIGGTTFFPAREFSIGDSVGPSETYVFTANAVAFSFAESVPLLGERAIVGIELTLDTGVHFGWIELTRVDGPVAGDAYQPTAWAYETTPGAPAEVVEIPDQLCTADTNADGGLTPADFNAWVIAFNQQAPQCDQNGDGLCTPADFNAWIANYNAGC